MAPSSEPSLLPAVRIVEAADPVTAFLEAHQQGRPVALPTSGSSARPRSVVRSTRSWTASFRPVERLAGLAPLSRVWVPGPLTSTMNLFAAVHARFLGAELVSSPGAATHAVLTPAMLERHLDSLAGAVAVVAGDGLSPALHARAAGAGIGVCHYYGAAELSFVAWGPHREALRPFPGVEVRIHDGEIVARSPYVCQGYDGGPGPLRRGPDGFATVGDRGRLDGGVLTVLGRNDAVTTAGATVHLADVEAVLRPEARGDLVVIGAAQERLGAVLSVVLTDPADLVPLRTVARERLAGAERPRWWFHLSSLPLTATGKVDRGRLAELVSAGGGAGVRRLS